MKQLPEQLEWKVAGGRIVHTHVHPQLWTVEGMLLEVLPEHAEPLALSERIMVGQQAVWWVSHRCSRACAYRIQQQHQHLVPEELERRMRPARYNELDDGAS